MATINEPPLEGEEAYSTNLVEFRSLALLGV
jgi:hypothetical protein